MGSLNDQMSECRTCLYYCTRTAFHNERNYRLEWCENQKSDNYKQLLEEITECNKWEKKNVG